MPIRQADKYDAQTLATIISTSNETVARRYNLTPKNCPKHPSNCTTDWIKRDIDRGVTYYVLEDESGIIGCVALEKATEEMCYLERFAVLPKNQKQGFGHQLFEHFLFQAKVMGFKKIGIGIIDKQYDLKSWYKKLGFIETGTKDFEHLPFTVAFMQYHITKKNSDN